MSSSIEKCNRLQSNKSDKTYKIIYNLKVVLLGTKFHIFKKERR